MTSVSVEAPAEDDDVAEWIELQDEGAAHMTDFAEAVTSGDRDAQDRASNALLDFGERDRRTAVAPGLPDNCVSEEPPDAPAS